LKRNGSESPRTSGSGGGKGFTSGCRDCRVRSLAVRSRARERAATLM